MLRFAHPLFAAIATRFMHPQRIKILAQILPAYLNDAEEVLDFGAGDGKLAALLSKQVNARFVGCDTVVRPTSEIVVTQYDGITLPFADKSFQYVMLVDMLHHARDQKAMLLEAKRVSREYVLIKDHYWKTPFDRAWLSMIDYVGNAGYGVDVPYNFLREKEWDALIDDSGFDAIQTTKMRWSVADPIHQVIFKLKKRR